MAQMKLAGPPLVVGCTLFHLNFARLRKNIDCRNSHRLMRSTFSQSGHAHSKFLRTKNRKSGGNPDGNAYSTMNTAAYEPAFFSGFYSNRCAAFRFYRGSSTMRHNLSLPSSQEAPEHLLFEAQGAAFLLGPRLTRHATCRAAADVRPQLSQSVLSTSNVAFIPCGRVCHVPL